MKNDDYLLPQLGGTILRRELDKIPLWRGDHVGVKQLCEDFAKYIYLPRIVVKNVLLAAIRDGLSRLTWQSETFAHAERFDDSTRRYVGLQAGQTSQIVLDGQSVLVKSEAASRQIAADQGGSAVRAESSEPAGTVKAGEVAGRTSPATGQPAVSSPTKPIFCRFHGSVDLDTLRIGTKAGDVAREVIQHLSTLQGAKVRVVLEIEADIPDGATEDVIRTVTENCRTLRFNSHSFEEN